MNSIETRSQLDEVHVQGMNKEYSCKNYIDNPENYHNHNGYDTAIYRVETLKFAGRYLMNVPDDPDTDDKPENKEMTKDEVFFLCRSGLGIVSIWQWSGRDPNELNTEGKLHASNAIGRATTLGQHAGTPIFFAFEYVNDQKKEKEIEIAKKYFSDVNSVFSDDAQNPKGYKLGAYTHNRIAVLLRKIYRDIYIFSVGSEGMNGDAVFEEWDIKQSCMSFLPDESMRVDWIISPETSRARECSWRHKFGDIWKSDQPNYHYVDCTECGYRHTESHRYGKYEICDEGKKHSRTCAVCGHLEISNHVYEDGWTSIDDRRHKRTCVCGHEDVRPHNYTVTKTETGHRLVCQTCGHVIEGAHTFGAWGRTDDSNHARRCSVCGYSESYPHNFLTWEYNDADTHKRQCPICNWWQKTNHNYSKWQDTKGSQHTHSCSECGHTETEDHNFGPWKNVSVSSHERRCIDCDYIERAGHNFNDWVPNPASPSTHKRTCPVCNGTETQAHSYGSCTSISSTKHQHTCSVCKHVGTEGHSFGYRRKDNVVHEKYCTKCSYSTIEDHVPNTLGTKCTKCGSTIERPNPIDSDDGEVE